jgi:hypothetical protein
MIQTIAKEIANSLSKKKKRFFFANLFAGKPCLVGQSRRSGLIIGLFC